MIGTNVYSLIESTGITYTAEGAVDDSLASMVLISWFTDKRADTYDELPDGSTDLRGWPGDTYSDDEWGCKLWLLYREKLTTDVRNKAVKYAEDALAWMTQDDGNGVMAASVTVTSSIPLFQVLQLTAKITKTDGSQMTITAQRRWEARSAV